MCPKFKDFLCPKDISQISDIIPESRTQIPCLNPKILIVCFHAQRNGQVPFPIECSRAYSSWESSITTSTIAIIYSDVAMATVYILKTGVIFLS